MKFVIAVVMLALVFGAQSSVVPLSYTAVHGPAIAYAAAPSPIVYTSPHIIASPSHIAYHAAPAVYAAPHVVAVPAEGTYVAQTRGAVHVAPLAGHANSASSVNLEPAPGTL